MLNLLVVCETGHANFFFWITHLPWLQQVQFLSLEQLIQPLGHFRQLPSLVMYWSEKKEKLVISIALDNCFSGFLLVKTTHNM